MANINYYVSQQNGNDENDGLTPNTAWKTLTKASTTVPTPADGDTNYVNIGPGIYRERFIPLNDGLNANSKIIYRGDKHCQYLTSDAPGRVRITGCDVEEYPTNGRVLDWTGKSCVELWDVEVDGSGNDYACCNVPISRRVKATSKDGFYYGTNYNCTAMGGHCSFYYGTNYNCTAIGGFYGFYYGTNYNCTAIGGFYGFNNGTNYNCTVIGGHYGFYSATNYNCTAIGGYYGFRDGTNYNCTAIGGYHGFYYGTNYNCKTLYVDSSSQIAAKHITLDLDDLMPKVIDAFGVDEGGFVSNKNISTSATMNLQTERFVVLTPSDAGKSLGLQLWMSSLASIGNITVELQKNISGTWTAQKSKTLSVSDLQVGWNTYYWNTGTGDDMLTAAANTWRFCITADLDASSTVIYGSNATTPSYMSLINPSDERGFDINGLSKNGVVKSLGSVMVPTVTLDDAVFHTSGPSVKISGYGEHALKLPVRKNVAVTVSYQVRHDGAASGEEPQISMRHYLLTMQTATHSAGANTWQDLSITFTPTFDGEVDIILTNRSSWKNAWFSDPTVS